MNKEQLNEVLKKHLMFLKDEEGGEKANLSDANLRGASLSGSNLSGSNLIYFTFNRDAAYF